MSAAFCAAGAHFFPTCGPATPPVRRFSRIFGTLYFGMEVASKRQLRRLASGTYCARHRGGVEHETTHTAQADRPGPADSPGRGDRAVLRGLGLCRRQNHRRYQDIRRCPDHQPCQDRAYWQDRQGSQPRCEQKRAGKDRNARRRQTRRHHHSGQGRCLHQRGLRPRPKARTRPRQSEFRRPVAPQIGLGKGSGCGEACLTLTKYLTLTKHARPPILRP